MINYQRFVIVHSPKSTRAGHYRRISGELRLIAKQHKIDVVELELTDVPYFQAVKQITAKIKDGDLVVAAGGDGISQATFNAVYASHCEAVFMTLPLGNGNDISRAINGRRRSVGAILSENVADFYPLNVVVDKGKSIALISYITFGATTVLVDYLNRNSSRRSRKLLKNLSPAAAVPVTKLNEISRQISELDFPDFERDNNLMTDDSIGFFLIPAAHNVLRLPKDITWASSEFYFHHASTKDRGLASKIVMAGTWVLHFPGEMTELEELKFLNNHQDIIANISGDNVNLGPIHHLTAIRSTRAVKVLANK